MPKQEDTALCAATPLPQLNGHVERAHRTHTEEFYEVVDSDFTAQALASPWLKWEAIYNRVRPHQALGYLTPTQWLDKHHQKTKDEMVGQRPTDPSCSAKASISHPVKKGGRV